MLEWCCEEREYREDRGEFVYLRDRDGWVFVDGPMRRMSVSAMYYAAERGVENHTGEPYCYTSCPWCGADLPRPEEPRHPWQADGEEGG